MSEGPGNFWATARCDSNRSSIYYLDYTLSMHKVAFALISALQQFALVWQNLHLGSATQHYAQAGRESTSLAVYPSLVSREADWIQDGLAKETTSHFPLPSSALLTFPGYNHVTRMSPVNLCMCQLLAWRKTHFPCRLRGEYPLFPSRVT